MSGCDSCAVSSGFFFSAIFCPEFWQIVEICGLFVKNINQEALFAFKLKASVNK